MTFTTLRRAGARLLGLGLAVALTASCKSGDGPTGTGGSISISLSSSTLTITQGANGTVTVNLTRAGGFTGAVTVAAEGLPTGVTASSITIAEGETSAQMSISAVLAALVGNSTITLRATGTGVDAVTATLTLTLSAASSGAFTLSLSSPTATLTQGTVATTVTVTIARTGGFAGAVALTSSGSPTGVTASFSPTTIAAGSTTATLTLTPTVAAALGNATITITGTSSGVTTQNATLTLTVNAAAAGSFTLSLSGATATVTQGGAAATITVTVNRAGGFTGAVALTAPTTLGVTTSFNPTTIPAGSTTSVLTLTPPAGATVGSGTVVITGTSSGVANATANVTLTVNASGGGGGNVTVQFCPSVGLPIWVAAQNGAGAWTRVTGTAEAYSFTVTSIGGIAYVRTLTGGGFSLRVFYGTVAELQALSASLCGTATGAGKTHTGTVTGLSGFESANITLGQVAATANVALPTFTLSGVANGSLDLLAVRSGLVGSAFLPLKGLLRRSINQASGTAVNVDFTGADAFDFATPNLTLTGLNGETSGVITSYLTANNTNGLIATEFSGSAATTRPYYGVPAIRQVAGDLHLVTVVASTLTQLAPTRTVQLVFNSAVAKAVTLGPTLTNPTVGAVPGGVAGRLRAALTIQVEYNRVFVFDVQTTATGGASERMTQVQQSSNYAAAATGATYNLDVPDLSAAAGFLSTWLLQAGGATTWTVTATGFTSGSGVAEGAIFSSGTRQGSITP